MADDADWMSEDTAEPAAPAADEEGAPPPADDAAAPGGEEELEELDDDEPVKRRDRGDRPILFRYWKRPVTLQYAYLYDYRHSYYDDVIDYLDKRQRGIQREIPRAQTWAERALRTTVNKNRSTEEHYRREKDASLMSEIRTSNRFFRYHSKDYFNTKYARIL